MARKKKYSVLLALADAGSTCCLEQILTNQSEVSLSISILEDPYTLLNSVLELAPDLLVVSPQVLSDPMVPLFKNALGDLEVSIISYCQTLVELDMNKHFDGKILSTDGESEVVNMLESVLEVDGSSDEEMVLTPREQEVVVAVVKGLTNKEIAAKFFLSTHTIITHRRNIARKLNIHSPSGLTIYAIMNKLVTLDEVKDHM